MIAAGHETMVQQEPDGMLRNHRINAFSMHSGFFVPVMRCSNLKYTFLRFRAVSLREVSLKPLLPMESMVP